MIIKCHHFINRNKKIFLKTMQYNNNKIWLSNILDVMFLSRIICFMSITLINHKVNIKIINLIILLK